MQCVQKDQITKDCTVTQHQLRGNLSWRNVLPPQAG